MCLCGCVDVSRCVLTRCVGVYMCVVFLVLCYTWLCRLISQCACMWLCENEWPLVWGVHVDKSSAVKRERGGRSWLQGHHAQVFRLI